MDQPFTERRLRFMDAIGEGLAVVPGAQEIMRNADTNHDFRQASDFFFLTGFDEPDAVAVFNPTHVKERYVLFVRPRDREMEIWNGYRAGIEGAVARYGADAAYSIDELDQKLRDYGLDRPVLYYRLGNPAFDPRITRLVGELRAARARGYTPPTRLEDSPGLMEYQVQAVLEYVFRMNGSRRNAYPSIVGSGPNACILHYLENNRRMEDGDLLLIDAGCEYGYQASDITRTFPVNGRFTAPQRAIYEIVLRAQLAGIAAAKPGQRYEAVHDAARRVLTEGLVALRLLPLGVEESLAMHHYREFYMHGTGHWLGMDVHDVGDYRIRGGSRDLEPGMVFTVEPGLYFDPARESATFYLREFSEQEMLERRLRLGAAAARRLDEEEKAKAERIVHPIPREFRGIGVRIEDDVLITASGRDVLTVGVPKTIEEVERVCAEAPRLPRW